MGDSPLMRVMNTVLRSTGLPLPESQYPGPTKKPIAAPAPAAPTPTAPERQLQPIDLEANPDIDTNLVPLSLRETLQRQVEQPSEASTFERGGTLSQPDKGFASILDSLYGGGPQPWLY